MKTKKAKKTPLTPLQKDVETHCRKLAASRKGEGKKRSGKKRLGGPYVSLPLAEKFEAWSDHIGIAQTDIMEGLLSKLLRIN